MKQLFAIIFLLLSVTLYAQLSEGGIPMGFVSDRGSMDVKTIQLAVPNLDVELKEDLSATGETPPYRIAVGIPVDISLSRDGAWSNPGSKGRFLSLGIKAEKASGIILYYSHFSIPEGGRLFIYSADKSQLIGAFTSRNNPSGGYFATELIIGDELLLEYDAPGLNTEEPRIEIYQVHYVYRDLDFMEKGPSGACEVNVNCPEGESWQNEKRSVGKIVIKAGLGTYLCTGALINNVRQDSTPYFLTARHCGSSASLSDYSQWVFHFNYEALGCEDPDENPPPNTITGSTLLAEAPSGTTAGSDFKLLELNHNIPENYNPYFSGWNRDGVASPSGTGIHHPKGDIKKISTFTNPLLSVQYGTSSQDPNGYYWKVVWSETASGHGVTEGGSSGSPIFDNTGRIVGTLTGGAASCQDLLGPDYYGKFSYHWSSNGSPGGAQLRPYLDPDNTGAQSLNGFGYGNRLIANFDADTTVVSIGGQVSFTDRSGGEPESWAWAFSGGDPSLQNVQNPYRIVYNDYGLWNVSLIVADGLLSDTLLRKGYVRVTPNLYPNPANEKITLDFGRRQVEYIEVEVFDMQGRIARKYTNSAASSGIWTISVGDLKSGTYVLRITTNIMVDHLPLVIY